MFHLCLQNIRRNIINKLQMTVIIVFSIAGNVQNMIPFMVCNLWLSYHFKLLDVLIQIMASFKEMCRNLVLTELFQTLSLLAETFVVC